MRALHIFLSLLTSISILHCGQLTTEPNSVLPMLEVHQERSTGVHLKREEIITSSEKWQAVWQEIVSNRSPKPPTPAVDFSSYVLVFVARGDTGDACRDISISRVELRQHHFEVFVNDTRPPMSCSCPPFTVQPVDVVAVPRVAESAAFHYQSLTVGPECN